MRVTGYHVTALRPPPLPTDITVPTYCYTRTSGLSWTLTLPSAFTQYFLPDIYRPADQWWKQRASLVIPAYKNKNPSDCRKTSPPLHYCTGCADTAFLLSCWSLQAKILRSQSGFVTVFHHQGETLRFHHAQPRNRVFYD